jgi:hypothetical protein
MLLRTTFFAFLLTFFLTSCKEEKREGINSKSPDGNITLSVAAIRQSSLDPWKTTLKAEGSSLKGEITFELYAGDVSYENISFGWDKEGNCLITFTQQDDTKRIFEFAPNSSSAIWKDLTEK